MFEQHNDLLINICMFIPSHRLIELKSTSRTLEHAATYIMTRRCQHTPIMSGHELKVLIRTYCNQDLDILRPSYTPASPYQIDDLLDNYGYIGQWNVSHVKDFSFAFYGMLTFNESIEMWDVSNATDMSFMFADAYYFDQPLSRWNVSKVQRMHCMFSDARSFKQDINSWNVEQLRDTGYMFCRAHRFTGPLDRWSFLNIPKVHAMFYDARSFDWEKNGLARTLIPTRSQPPDDDYYTEEEMTFEIFSKDYIAMVKECTRLTSETSDHHVLIEILD